MSARAHRPHLINGLPTHHTQRHMDHPHRDHIHTHTHTRCISLWVLTVNVEIHTYVNTQHHCSRQTTAALLCSLGDCHDESEATHMQQQNLHITYCVLYDIHHHVNINNFLTRYYFISNSRTIFLMDWNYMCVFFLMFEKMLRPESLFIDYARLSYRFSRWKLITELNRLFDKIVDLLLQPNSLLHEWDQFAMAGW